ncbi:hypothetical protein PIB30_096091, partial [Stylosanthes scabra]|nr:hypothetical protein [Stylosanthes scabra]
MEEWDVMTWNSLIGELVRLGALGKAFKVFDEMPERDVVSWNIISHDGPTKESNLRSPPQVSPGSLVTYQISQ